MNLVDFQQWASDSALVQSGPLAWEAPTEYVLWLDGTGRLHILLNLEALAIGARTAHSLATFDDPTAALAAYRLMNETGVRE